MSQGVVWGVYQVGERQRSFSLQLLPTKHLLFAFSLPFSAELTAWDVQLLK